MNIYIIGLPQSGRTTVAKAIAHNLGYVYVSATDWVKVSFREPHDSEHAQSYNEAFQKYFFERLKNKPNMCIDNVLDIMACQPDSNFIIDGISSPKDFISLFDYNKDIVVLLNRIDNDQYHYDHDSIFMSTIKDYCFWLASAELLKKSHWIEYNFKIHGEDIDSVKIMGNKNSVYLIKHINRVIPHLEEKIKELTT